MEITIDLESKDNPRLWHILVKMNDKKPEETVCPKDIFGYTVENYVSLLNFIRVLHFSTQPLRKQLNTMSRLPKKPKADISTQITQPQKTKRQRQEEYKQAQQKQRTVSMLTQSLETVKHNIE